MKWGSPPIPDGTGAQKVGPQAKAGGGDGVAMSAPAPPQLPSRWFQAWEQGRDRVSQINPHLRPGYQFKFLPSLGASEQQTNPGEGLLLQGPRKH